MILDLADLCEALEFKHLPYAGGLLDQPYTVWHDIKLVLRQKTAIKKMREADAMAEGLSAHG